MASSGNPVESAEKRTTRSDVLRHILADSPSTCDEIAALMGLSLRRAWVAVWVLTSQGHAEIVGRVPKELGKKGHAHNLYGLTKRGLRAARRIAEKGETGQ